MKCMDLRERSKERKSKLLRSFGAGEYGRPLAACCEDQALLFGRDARRTVWPCSSCFQRTSGVAGLAGCPQMAGVTVGAAVVAAAVVGAASAAVGALTAGGVKAEAVVLIPVPIIHSSRTNM